MATAPEILAIEKLHQAAQARLGFAAAFLSLAEWQAVAPLNPAATAASWLTFSLKAIVAIRILSRRLAVQHYQLIRALETGRTLGVPEGSPSTTTSTTLGSLRSSFRKTAIDIASLPSPLTRSDDPNIRWFEEQLASIPKDFLPGAIHLDDIEVDPLIQSYMDVEGGGDAKAIPVDKYTWPEDMSLDQVDAAYRDLLRKQAEDTGSRVKDLRKSADLSPDEVLTQIETTHASAGSIGSGTVDAAGIASGRDAMLGAIRNDRLVLAVARGTGPDPCAFCALLAGRGFVYKSEATAGVGDSETIVKYHIHCHCYPIFRFVRASELPALNAYFQEKWPEVTQGYSGHDAVKAWRRWIYAQRKANPGAPHGISVFARTNP
ncbi:MAG TPA: hypothetical protein VF867_19680 [Arthrobacter sp.]